MRPLSRLFAAVVLAAASCHSFQAYVMVRNVDSVPANAAGKIGRLMRAEDHLDPEPQVIFTVEGAGARPRGGVEYSLTTQKTDLAALIQFLASLGKCTVSKDTKATITVTNEFRAVFRNAIAPSSSTWRRTNTNSCCRPGGDTRKECRNMGVIVGYYDTNLYNRKTIKSEIASTVSCPSTVLVPTSSGDSVTTFQSDGWNLAHLARIEDVCAELYR